jgi:hypothetical protein
VLSKRSGTARWFILAPDSCRGDADAVAEVVGVRGMATEKPLTIRTGSLIVAVSRTLAIT